MELNNFRFQPIQLILIASAAFDQNIKILNAIFPDGMMNWQLTTI